MGKFRRQNFRRKAGELNFEGFIFEHMPTTRIFYRKHWTKRALVMNAHQSKMAIASSEAAAYPQGDPNPHAGIRRSIALQTRNRIFSLLASGLLIFRLFR